MNLINHSEITKKIKGYLDSEMISDVTLTNESKDTAFAKLGLMFGNSFDTPGYLGNLRMIEMPNNTLYYFDAVAVDKQKKTDYIAICEDNKPLLLISNSESKNNEIVFSEQSFSTYDKETKRLVSRIKSDLIIVNDSRVLDINLLDKNKEEYYRKDYRFYFHYDKVVAYQIGADRFLTQDDARDARLIFAINKVDDVSNKIKTSIDEVLGINQEYVKEYNIKRKVK